MGTLQVQSAVYAISEAIFSKSPLAVVESDSFDSEPRRFATIAEFCGYVETQKAAACGSVHIAVLYPDMGGRLAQSRRDFATDTNGGPRYGISIQGWGVVRIYLDLKGGRPLGSFVSANTQKRAERWAATYPELDSPSTWNWGAVTSHERRLARVLKQAASTLNRGAHE
jgi:hypothetical protein